MSAPTQAAISSSSAAADSSSNWDNRPVPLAIPLSGRPTMMMPAPVPLFVYKRPPPGSLDPANPADLLRLRCLVVDVLRVLGRHRAFWDHMPAASFTESSRTVRVMSASADALEADGTARAAVISGVTLQFDMMDWSDHQDTAHVNKALHVIGDKQGNRVAMVEGQTYHETWPDWDIVQPTRTLTRDEVRDPPAKSILGLPETQEILAIWQLVGPKGQTFTLGPTHKERFKMWDVAALEKEAEKVESKYNHAHSTVSRLVGLEKAGTPQPGLAAEQEMLGVLSNAIRDLRAKIKRAEETRRRLAVHLAAQPGIFIDMAHDPMCPWKGMKFFHGSSYAKLQEVAKPEAVSYVHLAPLVELEGRLSEVRGALARSPSADQHLENEKMMLESRIAYISALSGYALWMRITRLRSQLYQAKRELAEGERQGVSNLAIDRHRRLIADGMQREITDLEERAKTDPLHREADEANARLDAAQREFNDSISPQRERLFTALQKLKEETRVIASRLVTPPSSAPTRYPCKLGFDTTYVDSEGRTRQGSAFLSPYYTKGFSYGGETPHIYTYKLNKDGKELRFLDLRNDYVQTTWNHERFDPFKPIWELSGIPHAEEPHNIKIRDEKARNLYELFKDERVDGAVMNADVEFIFFHPGDLLDWVVPTPDKWLTTRLLNLPGGATVSTLPLSGLASGLVKLIKDEITTEDVEDFLASDLTTVRQIQLSQLPFARWSLDISYATYISQFAVNRPTRSPLWTESQHVKADSDDEEEIKRQMLTVYECDYYKLWRYFAPNGELDDIWMADSITEGSESGISRKTPLAYHQLCTIMRQNFEDVHLLVHLPNGFVQIVPTLQTYELDPRLHHVTILPEHRTRQDMDRNWAEPIPRRTLWQPAATVGSLVTGFLAAAAAAGSKRKDPATEATEEEEKEEAERAKGQRTGAKLCIV